jgi:vesicle coat complex subunit
LVSRYATEIDVHFVRKAVRAIGKLAIKIESAAKQCIDTLLDLVNAKIPYIVQEATVVIRNIFRKYPNQYESIIGQVIQNIDELDEPEAKAAIIWIIGQYADRIENSDGLLQDYLATFHDETIEVQLALLTATVKLFIQRPTKGQQLVPQVLKWCTEETDDPDLRDRGYMYWRLLSTDPTSARQVVMGQKPPISAESEKLDSRTLEELCLNVGTLATVYLKPVQQVFRSARTRRLQYSPALQKTQEDLTSPSWQIAAPVAAPNPVTSPNAAANGSATTPGGSTHDAVNAADNYFSSVAAGTQQMAALDLGGREDGGLGGGGAPPLQYVVNQNQQQAYQPQLAGGAATGELLLL